MNGLFHIRAMDAHIRTNDESMSANIPNQLSLERLMQADL